MDALNAIPMATAEQDKALSDTVRREGAKLRNFIRSRVPDASDAEDVLQDVFYELVESYRLPQSIENAGAWLFRVARNKITDLFRKKRPESLDDEPPDADSGLTLADLLPSPDAGPEAAYARSVLLAEIEGALEELPADQRAVFVAHEIEGRSFKALAAETGVSVNTLLSRKRYAVLHLRERLREIYDEGEDL